MRIQEISGTGQAGRSADNHYHAFMSMLEAGSDELADMAWYLSRIGRTDRPLPYKPGERTLRVNKDGILKVVLSAIRNADAGEFDDDDLRDMLRALRKMGIEWTELDTIERSLDQDTPKESQMRLHELAERISKPSGPERFVTGIGKATIPNPAHTSMASYEGDPDGYDFGPQRRNYEVIKAALARNGMRFDYIGAAKTGPRRDRFVATAPGLIWYKYDSSGNELYMNGARLLTSEFVGSTLEEQDAILKSDPADLVWKITKDPVAYATRLVQMGINGDAFQDRMATVKAAVITKMLRTVRDRSDDQYKLEMKRQISGLRKMGIKWPELDVIEKSIKADT